MIVIQPNSYYLGVWYVSIPGMGIDLIVTACKEDKNSDKPFEGQGLMRFFVSQEQMTMVFKPETIDEQETIIKVYEFCEEVCKQYHGGTINFIPTHTTGLETFEILRQQPWMREVNQVQPEIILPQQPVIEDLKAIASKFLDEGI